MCAVHISVMAANESSVPEVARLHHDHLLFHEAFDPRYRPLPARNYESVYRELMADPTAHVLVARLDSGEIVGFVTLRLHCQVPQPGVLARWMQRFGESPRAEAKRAGSATLVDLFVAEPHRRGGVGRALVSAAMAWFVEQGVREVNLGVMWRNEAGLAFWRRMGFDEYRLLMRRQLDG